MFVSIFTAAHSAIRSRLCGTGQRYNSVCVQYGTRWRAQLLTNNICNEEYDESFVVGQRTAEVALLVNPLTLIVCFNKLFSTGCIYKLAVGYVGVLIASRCRCPFLNFTHRETPSKQILS
jgi:hypothetical protein